MPAALALLLLLLTAGPAHAGYLSASNGFVNLTARDGEVNDVSVAAAAGWLEVRDAAPIAVATNSGCERVDEHHARCPAEGVQSLSVSLGDGDDVLVLALGTGPLQVGASGGDGNDRISSAGATNDNLGGGYGDDSLTGGAGDDQLDGGPGRDALAGGDGNDLLHAGYPDEERYGEAGGGGADAFLGGPGLDAVVYKGLGDVRVTLDGAANDGRAGEGDDVGSDVETIEGGLGDDVLVGDDGTQRLLGGVGDDAIAGLGGDDALEGFTGADLLDAGAGDDLIDSRESNVTVCYLLHDPIDCPGTRDGADAIVCGAGADRLTFEREDVVDRRTCEEPLNPEWAPEDDRQPALLVSPAVKLRRQGREASVTAACTGRRTCRGAVAIEVEGRRLGREAVTVRRGRVATVGVRLARGVPRSTPGAVRFTPRGGKARRQPVLLRP